MTATYDATAIETSDKDRLRWLVGDTGPDFRLEDSEITAARDLAAGIFNAAADLCLALAGKFAPRANISIEGLGIGSGQARYYLDLAKSYRAQAVLAGEGTSDTPPGGSAGVDAPVATGLSIGDMIANDRDCDRPRSHFGTVGRSGYGYRGWW